MTRARARVRAKTKVATDEPRPFLHWAGGKKSSAGVIIPKLLAGRKFIDDTYIEPFLGGGAIFFELRRRGPLRGPVRLSDVNSALMDTYRVVRDRPLELLRHLAARSRYTNDEEAYYAIRDRFNDEETYYEARERLGIDVAVNRAADLIYLNRAGFNGLYRVNQAGEFNVSFGRRKTPLDLTDLPIMACSRALAGVVLDAVDFSAALSGASAPVTAYLDPPYLPVSKTSNFSAYHHASGYRRAGGMRDAQQDLVRHHNRIWEEGGVSIMSAADTAHEMYDFAHVERVLVPRCINSKADKRGPVYELLISGTPPTRE